ncbi:membrane protein [Paenibacillus montaniterrae]|uniref:Membrane protein n=1 Tax=Paenibacillus montaniterrae TaxID=429341 RepID=A0A920CXX6_9BACL|nr:DUF3231 family protein [Paenibacillus montaniterrae]GIP17361.1 membrane protein [Paenibacillus montaniterrae]
MGILSGNPKEEPMHYGEIFNVWSYSLAAKGKISCYHTLLQHTGDADLKKLLDDLIDEAKLEAAECDQLLSEHELVPAPFLPEKPKAALEEIPVGARFSDPEIGSAIAMDNVAALVACSQAMGAAIREDIGALFAKYHASKTALAVRILRMNKEKGWLIPPPLQLKKADKVEA